MFQLIMRIIIFTVALKKKKNLMRIAQCIRITFCRYETLYKDECACRFFAGLLMQLVFEKKKC